METGLIAKNISKRFGKTEVLRNVSLVAPMGQITALIGQNGAGKSTFFKILMSLVRPDSGDADLDGRKILHLPLNKKAQAGLGYLPQECASFEELTVRENLLALLEILPLSKNERGSRLNELLGLTGIGPLADRRFAMLSRGEQRRLEIAKALAIKPRVLLLDEPFSGLDPRIVEELATILRNLVNRPMGILLTDHNVNLTLRFADYVYLLAGGIIVCEGTPDFIVNNKDAKDLYLGSGFKI